MSGVGELDVHVSLSDFCDRHAKAAASDLVTAFCSYKAFRCNEGIRPPVALYTEFAKKFAEKFVLYFETEFVRRNPLPPVPLSGSVLNNSDHQHHGPPQPQTNISEYLSDVSDEVDSSSPKIRQKPFFRRLSFRGLRKGKGFFRKQDNGDSDSSAVDKKLDKNMIKVKLANIVVECRKQGYANYLVAENMDGQPKWEKCRLTLTTSAAGGYILVFYNPPKSTKPKLGVFCHLITEVRETTALEMPDMESTFVVRAAFNAEYVIQCQTIEERRDWVATLKYCIRESRAAVERSDRMSTGTVNEGSAYNRAVSMNGDIPELPPRSLDSMCRMDSLSSSLRSDTHNDFDGDSEIDPSVELMDYPWFHGTLVRSDATNLVQHSGENGHGVFLVRQSETRRGEFVLTFNFHGKAKHLRLLLNELRQCCVQHLWFPTIFDALEHFRQNSIPLENGGVGDVRLTEFIINTPNPPPPPAPLVHVSSNGAPVTEVRQPAAPPLPRED